MEKMGYRKRLGTMVLMMVIKNTYMISHWIRLGEGEESFIWTVTKGMIE